MILLVFSVFRQNAMAQMGSADMQDNADGGSGVLCGGVERWAVKVLTDAAAVQVNYTPRMTTLDSLVHIATTSSTTAPRIAGIEFQNYTITCNITIKKNEDDNDYHLVLKSGNETMVGEVPDPVCAVAASSGHVNEFIASRNWVNTHIGTGAVANVSLPAVDITGVSFVDVSHGQTGAAPNQMEIHPILNILFSTTTGVSDMTSSAPAFRVSVNPSQFSESTLFRVTSGRDMFGRCTLELFSVGGTRVTEVNLPLTSRQEIGYTFMRNGLPGGVYIYRMRNDGAILYEGRIIIQ